MSHQFSKAKHHLWGKAEYTHPEKNGSASFLPVHLVAVQVLKLEAKYHEDEDSKNKPAHSSYVGFTLLNRIKRMYLSI